MDSFPPHSAETGKTRASETAKPGASETDGPPSDAPQTGPVPTIRIGISACLLGQPVRYDGGHKRDRFIHEMLGRYFTWVPVCPEVELGLGTPRDTIRLVGDEERPRLVVEKTGLDLTQRMTAYAQQRVEALAADQLSGYLLKKDSPSCGMERVKVYPLPRGPARKRGRGLFAAALRERLPQLPVEEEGRLCDPRLRENWISRVFAYHDLQTLWRSRWGVGDLVRFHTRYKLVVLAHCPARYQQLGRLVAGARGMERGELRTTYEATFMEALTRIATTRKNTNVLQHMLGFFKKQLDAAARRELLTHIEDYRRGLVPLIVPVTLIRHYVRLLEVAYLADQVYLNPHPKELALRNHV